MTYLMFAHWFATKIQKESPSGVCCTSKDVTDVHLGTVAQTKQTTF